MSMSEREKLLSILFDTDDKRVLNVKFFRGTSSALTGEQFFAAAREVIADTWENEGRLVDCPPRSSAQTINIR